MRMVTFVAALTVAMIAQGCLLDFDQFDTADGGTVVTTDGGSDGEVDADMGPNNPMVPLGDSCDETSVCAAGGTCVTGICTTACESDDVCPDGTRCGDLAGEDLCLKTCEETCESETASLACASAFGVEGNVFSACQPDADLDLVVDASDNCVDVPNPEQRDVDGDGAGDACDDEVLCPDGHQDGRIAYGTVGADLQGFGLPAVVDGPLIPVIGGFGSDERPVATVHVIDRVATTFEEGPAEFPYPSGGHSVAQLGPQTFWASPGADLQGSAQFGDWYSYLNQSWSVGFSTNIFFTEPVSATASDGTVWTIAYSPNQSNGSFQWRLYRSRLDREEFATSRITTEANPREWGALRDPQGRLHFYSSVIAGSGWLVTVEPGSLGSQQRSITYEIDSTRDFSVVMVPGPGETFWAFDKATGEAYRYELASGTVTPVQELDQTFDLPGARFITQSEGTAYIAVGNRDGSLEAYAKFLVCDASYDSLDSDGDGTADLVDNCPVVANEDQLDTDGDLIGDACDDDDDNDGILDSDDGDLLAEPPVDLSLDTDNDGMNNADDDDDDGDGVPDASDLFPLDTDNDGLSNIWDNDDDGDGFSDNSERGIGSELNPAVFPGLGQVVAIASEGGSRLVQIHDPIAGDVTDIATTTSEPHDPRFGPDGDHVLVLAGAPETTTTLEWLDTRNGAAPVQFELPVTVRGADPLSFDSVNDQLTNVTINFLQDETTGRWAIGTYGPQTMALNANVDFFANVRGADSASGNVAYIGGPTGCAECAKSYRSSLGGSTPFPVAEEARNPTAVRWNGQRYFTIADATESDGQAIFVGTGVEAVEILPPEGAEIRDVVGIADLSDVSLIASLRLEGGSFDLWVYNARAEAWHPLVEGSADYVEIDWRP